MYPSFRDLNLIIDIPHLAIILEMEMNEVLQLRRALKHLILQRKTLRPGNLLVSASLFSYFSDKDRQWNQPFFHPLYSS